MKERRALDALGRVNGKYVAEAAFPPRVKKKPTLWIGLAACLCLALAGIWSMNSNQPLGFVMRAYASDGTSYEISKTPTTIRSNTDSDWFSIYDEGNGRGRVTLPFRIVCEGENIASISYTIIGETNATNVSEIENNTAWFTTIQELPEKRGPGDFPEYATIGGLYICSYMGNCYSVAYNEQDNSEIFIEYRVKENGEQWTANPINVEVSITHDDGTVSKEQLLIRPAYEGGSSELRVNLK